MKDMQQAASRVTEEKDGVLQKWGAVGLDAENLLFLFTVYPPVSSMANWEISYKWRFYIMGK